MKRVRIGPPTGFMDRRSNPEDTPVNGYRTVLNWSVQQKLKLCRSTGWRKLLDRDDYVNFDLHDQLHAITGVSDRRPITFLFEASSANKTKVLLAGHDQTVFALLLGTGTYRVLNTTPMGVEDQTRWSATQNGEIVILTNDYDAPVYWPFDGTELSAIDDLATIGVTRAAVVATWNNFTFYMNVVENGTTKTFKIFWSDLDKPLSLVPADDSLAGSLELNTDESILAAKPLGNVLLIYTTRRIWQLSLAGGQVGDEVFSAAVRYDPEDGEACLAYKNTLVNTGEEHIYASHEGIYSYTLFKQKPILIEWVNRASSYIYDTLDKSRCDWFVAGFNPERREITYSWVDQNVDLPTSSLVLNTEFPFSSIVDHGFTAFTVCQPNEPVQTLKDWILDECICDTTEYAEHFGENDNEGGPCVAPDAVICADQPDSLYTTTTQALEDDIVMEDWNAEPSVNSLCSRLTETISQLCANVARRDECNAGRLFVMASADDLCLKEVSASFYREVCTNFEGCGVYALVGYKSLLRSGPLEFKDVSNEKRMSAFLVEAVAAASLEPGQMGLRVGVSSMALDSNDETCGIVWYEEDPRSLDCIAVDPATHASEKTRPDGDLSWPTFAIGQWMYYELTVENPDADVVDSGASVCISSLVTELESVQRRY